VVPSTWVALLLFVLFVMPGLVFDLLSQQRHARAAESTFREISRVVLASVSFSGITLAVLIGARILVPAGSPWPPEPGRLLQGDGQYIAANYVSLFWTLACGTVFSVFLAYGAHLILARRGGGTTIAQGSGWTQAFKDDCPPGKEPRVVVRLDDDSVYAGAINEFSADIEMADREITLRKPNLKVKRPHETAFTDVPSHYERIVLPASKIQAITVSFWPKS
jgi:hypothetical protein